MSHGVLNSEEYAGEDLVKVEVSRDVTTGRPMMDMEYTAGGDINLEDNLRRDDMRITRSCFKNKREKHVNIIEPVIGKDHGCPVRQRRTPGMINEEWIPIRNENARKYRAWKILTITPEEREALRKRKNVRVAQRRKNMGEDKARELARLQFARRKSRMTGEELKAYHEKRNLEAKLRRQKMAPEERSAHYEKRNHSIKLEKFKKAGKLIESKPPITVKALRKSYKINLFDYCIFCLRKTTTQKLPLQVVPTDPELAERLQEVPCAVDSTGCTRFLSTLNKAWGYLQKGGTWDWSKDSDDEQLTEHTVEFSSLPTMCQFCTEYLEAVHKLRCDLTAEINKLGKVIRESRFGGTHSWRAELFQKAIKWSCVELDSKHDTLDFFFKFGESISPTAALVKNNKVDGSKQCLSSYSTTVPSSTVLSSRTADRDEISGLSGSKTGPVPMDFDDEDSDASSMECDDTNDDPDYIKEENASSESNNSDDDGFTTNGILDDTCTFENICSTTDVAHSDSEKLPSTEPEPKHPTPTVDGVEANSKSSTSPDANAMFLTTVDPITRIKSVICTIGGCGRSFPSKFQLQSHQKYKHKIGRGNKIICNICATSYLDSSGYKTHMRRMHSHDGNNKISSLCDLCKVKVPLKDLYDHVRSHVGDEYLIKCPNPEYCPFVFCTANALAAHLKRRKTCREVIPDVEERYIKQHYVCEVCGVNIGTLLGLREHLLRNHENNGACNLTCPIDGCRQQFSVRQSVAFHIPFHVTKERVKTVQICEVCNEKINLEDMEQHLKVSHLVQQVIKCLHCDFLYASRISLLDHLYEHRRIALLCDICGESGPDFKRYVHLRRHYFTLHKIGKIMLCEQCPKEFFSAKCLENHVSRMHPKKAETSGKICLDVSQVTSAKAKKTFECSECTAVYKHKTSLRDHEIKVHHAEKWHCKFCEEKLMNYESLRRHEKKHRGIVQEDTFPCLETGCGMVFKAKSMLKRHLISAHTGERPHVCELCGKSYIDKPGLTFHKQSVHEGRGRCVCDVCGESFVTAGTLKRHKLIHTGERPFACKICDQRFRHSEVLKKHLDGHEKKGSDFRPTGAMKQVRKRVENKRK